jgi:hypothetical protein
MNKNILLDELPQYTKSGLQIRTDFRESIKFELLMQDRNLSEDVKIMQALQLYYYDPNKITDIKKAIDDILWFYKCGKEMQENNSINYEESTQEKTKQIYSYEFDDEYIFSAFLEQYGIDLNEIEYMHWWKFKALFNSLNENTQFVKVMSYRNMNIAKIKDKEMKAHYKKMQELYKLPDMRTEEEKESDFANELW